MVKPFCGWNAVGSTLAICCRFGCRCVSERLGNRYVLFELLVYTGLGQQRNTRQLANQFAHRAIKYPQVPGAPPGRGDRFEKELPENAAPAFVSGGNFRYLMLEINSEPGTPSMPEQSQPA